MITKTDLRLKYQKETGDSLDTINHMAENGDEDYVEWLEDSLIDMIKASKHMLDSIQPHLY